MTTVTIIKTEDLGELGFRNPGNIRTPHQFYIVKDNYRILYHADTQKLELTENRNGRMVKSSHKIDSIENLETLVKQFINDYS